MVLPVFEQLRLYLAVHTELFVVAFNQKLGETLDPDRWSIRCLY